MKTEICLAFLSLTGYVLLVHRVPGGITLITASLLTLSLLYLLFAFYFFSDRATRKRTAIISVLFGIFLAPVPAGILMIAGGWPGTIVILPVSAVTGATATLAATILKGTNRKPELKKYYDEVLLRTIVLTGLLLSLLLAIEKGPMGNPSTPSFGLAGPAVHNQLIK